MTTDLVAYLSFDGECQAAFKHYEKVLGGKILMMMRHADAPANAGVPQTLVSKPQGFCVSIMVDDPTEAERIFRELGEGGVVRMPIAETFWARRFGMLLDKFGIPWMVNCEKPAA
jgi:PhnB protein